MKICRTCFEPFTNKRFHRGFIDQCDHCSSNDVPRFLGRRMEKSIGIEIFRIDLPFVQSVLNRENRFFGPNINISHPIVEQKKEDWGQE